MDKFKESMDKLSVAQQVVILNSKNFDDAQRRTLANVLNLTVAENGQVVSTSALSASEGVATGTTLGLSSAFKGLWATLKANPIILVIGAAITALTIAGKEWDKYIHRLDDAKEKLNEISSELDSVNREIDETTSKIKELESLDSLSITDKEDLERLREQNKELDIRRRYLETQQQEQNKETVSIAKEEYNRKYGSSGTTREDIDNYKKYLSSEPTTISSQSKSNLYQTPNLSTGESLNYESDVLTILIAQYEFYAEKKKEAIKAENQADIDKYNKALQDTSTSIQNQRVELQGLKDDLSLTGESSAELDNVSQKLSTIDNALLSPGQNLVNFINNDMLAEDKAKLVELAESGKLTSDVLKERFSEVDEYLKQNGLTLEDLISIYRIYKDEVANSDTNETGDLFSYDKLSDIPQKLAEVENAYKTAKDALDSYNEKGYYSMDVIDSILSLEDEYVNVLVDENGQIQVNSDSMNQLARIKIEAAKASIYQQTCEELVRIKTLDTALAAQELALANGTLTQSAYETAKALYEEVVAMGGANAALANNVWDTATKKIKVLDNQLKSLSSGSYDVGKSVANSAKSAAKDAEQATKEYIDSYMNYMETSLESGRIDYQTYSRDVSKFLKDMYDQGKIAAKDYHDYTKQMLEVQKSAYDKVISAVTHKIEQQIKVLEKQKKSIESNYQSKIDAIQAEIDALEEANTKRKEQMELERLQYEAERARNQRTQLQYIGGQMVYNTDTSAIRDAEEEVAQKQHDMRIAELESQIKRLEEAMNAETDAIDSQIEKLNEYKDKWNEISEQYEIAQNEMIAQQILGADWETEILSGRLDVLNSFAESYFAIQQALADAAWASANEQIKAAQEAQKGAGGTPGGAAGITPETPKDIKGFGTNKKIKPIKNAYSSSGNVKNSYALAVKAKGGIITKKDSGDLDFIAKELGEDHMIGIQDGEAVVPKDSVKKNPELVQELLNSDDPSERYKAFMKMANSKSYESYNPTIKLNDGEEVPFYEFAKKFAVTYAKYPQPIPRTDFMKDNYKNVVTNNSTNSTICSIGDIHLHEVQNVDSFANAILRELPNKTIQAIHRR